ncbi:hypothetical protein [Absidia glauca]|uniref:DNA-directed RNA polymerases I and III subunit RPAC1 n=1 Tax=Absidia glauca TaxID=4829 RepID=A0A163M6S9_ABSGL|nr:hypothetical protein [Absidia glauca]
MATQPLSDYAEQQRARVLCVSDRLANLAVSDDPQHYPRSTTTWSLEDFKKDFKVKINRLTKHRIEFDLIGVDVSVANALRRIMIDEIPTIAIERVYVMNNTSVIQDDALVQRLALIPIKACPASFGYKTDHKGNPSELNTVFFKLKKECQRNPEAVDQETNPYELYINSHVYSGDLVWEPWGNQGERFVDDPIRPVQDDILIAKLRPGQEIDMEIHCTKGLGKDHAKWSPVATASYRLLPEINILQPIKGDDAIKFKNCFPEGVVALVKDDDEETMAKIVNPRKDTVVNKEVLRHKEFDNKVQLTRVYDHFIFNVESTGIIPPEEIFPLAVSILFQKVGIIQSNLEKLIISH